MSRRPWSFIMMILTCGRSSGGSFGTGAERSDSDAWGPSPARSKQPWFYVQLVRRGFAEGPVAGVLVCLAQLTTAAGFAAEWLKTRREGRTSKG